MREEPPLWFSIVLPSVCCCNTHEHCWNHYSFNIIQTKCDKCYIATHSCHNECICSSGGQLTYRTANMSKNISCFVFLIKMQVWVMWFKLHKSNYLDATPRKKSVQCTTDTYTSTVVERCWETFCKLAVRQYQRTGRHSHSFIIFWC